VVETYCALQHSRQIFFKDEGYPATGIHKEEAGENARAGALGAPKGTGTR